MRRNRCFTAIGVVPISHKVFTIVLILSVGSNILMKSVLNNKKNKRVQSMPLAANFIQWSNFVEIASNWLDNIETLPWPFSIGVTSITFCWIRDVDESKSYAVPYCEELIKIRSRKSIRARMPPKPSSRWRGPTKLTPMTSQKCVCGFNCRS